MSELTWSALWSRFRPLALFALIWLLILAIYEFKILKRPTLEVAPAKVVEQAAPVFPLVNVAFTCAAKTAFVTGVKLSGTGNAATVTDVRCESSFNDATTRCPALLPMATFGDSIRCPQAEAIHCHGGPLQTLGLFKDDSFCGDITDRDLGPPQEAPRPDED